MNVQRFCKDKRDQHWLIPTTKIGEKMSYRQITFYPPQFYLSKKPSWNQGGGSNLTPTVRSFFLFFLFLATLQLTTNKSGRSCFQTKTLQKALFLTPSTQKGLHHSLMEKLWIVWRKMEECFTLSIKCKKVLSFQPIQLFHKQWRRLLQNKVTGFHFTRSFQVFNPIAWVIDSVFSGKRMKHS